MTDCACLPEPPCDWEIDHIVAGLGLPIFGERGVVFLIQFARRVVGDVQEFDFLRVRRDGEHETSRIFKNVFMCIYFRFRRLKCQLYPGEKHIFRLGRHRRSGAGVAAVNIVCEKLAFRRIFRLRYQFKPADQA